LRTVQTILTNGLYAGQGRTRVTRMEGAWVRNRQTERVTFRKRVRPARPDEATYPISIEAVPPLVSADLFDAVQRTLAQARLINAHKRCGRRLLA
jgi:hypothetical protein